MADTANWRPDDNVVPTGGALQTPDSNRLCGNETTIGVSDDMDPNPDYDASDELEYAVSWFAWILRGVYPLLLPTHPHRPLTGLPGRSVAYASRENTTRP